MKQRPQRSSVLGFAALLVSFTGLISTGCASGPCNWDDEQLRIATSELGCMDCTDYELRFQQLAKAKGPSYLPCLVEMYRRGVPTSIAKTRYGKRFDLRYHLIGPIIAIDADTGRRLLREDLRSRNAYRIHLAAVQLALRFSDTAGLERVVEFLPAYPDMIESTWRLILKFPIKGGVEAVTRAAERQLCVPGQMDCRDSYYRLIILTIRRDTDDLLARLNANPDEAMGIFRMLDELGRRDLIDQAAAASTNTHVKEVAAQFWKKAP